MFSATEVMILSLTSLLTFLAIELMDMGRDCNAFKERFEAYKNGKSVNEIYSFLPGYKDGTRYIPDDKGGWDRITDDELADVFANLVVTPNKNRQEKVVNRPGLYDMKMREKLHNAGYVTQEMLDLDARMRYSTYLKEHKGELPLQQVSPEFDLLLLGSGLRSNSLTQKLWNERTLAKEMNKTFDRGLTGATKDMPLVYDAGQVINPEHVIRQGKISPRARIGVKESAPVEETVAPLAAVRKEAKLKAPYIGDDLQPSDLYQGLYERTPEIFEKTKVDLLSGLPVVEPVQELIYNGNLAKRIVPRQELGLHTHNILNPNIFTEQPKGLPGTVLDESLVDNNGNVNIRNVVKKIKQFYDDSYWKYVYAPDKYKDVTNYDANGKRTNLYEHIRDVVKSAQQIPVPEGYTRKQLVEAALYHDIGKVLDPAKHVHGSKSLAILDDLGIEVDSDVRNAIKHHMSNHMLDKDPLTQALHFADVARGLDWDNASFRFPHLAYNYKKPDLNIPKIPLREEIKTRINPWLRNKGYETIKLDVTEEEAWRLLEDRINQHLSFLRGVRDPLKDNPRKPDDIRNAVNSINGVMEKFGLGENYAKSPDASEWRMRLAGLYTSMSPTAPGRRNMLYDDHRSHEGLTEYDETYESKLIGANPNTKDGSYISTSDEVMSQYATANTDKRGEAGYIVRLPKHERVPGESMSEHLLKNDFEMIDMHEIKKGLIRGTGAMFEDPYRLLTGRSMLRDMLKEGIIKPQYVDNPDILIMPGLTIRAYHSHMPYETIEKAIDYINDNLKNLGITFQLSKSRNGGIYMPKKLLELNDDIRSLNNIKNALTPETGFNIRRYDDVTRRMINDAEDWQNWGIGMILNDSPIDHMDPMQRDALIEEMTALLDESYARYVFGDEAVDNAGGGRLYKYPYPNKLIKDLRTRGIITQKLENAMRKAYLHNGDPLKYINIKKIADDFVTKYLLSVKKNAHKKRKVDPKSLRPTVQQMIDFMRSKGVKPRYEIEGYGDNRVYVIDANKSNKTKNAGDIKRTYGYVLGDKGEKVFDIAEKVNTKKIYNPNHVGKDNGSYSKLKISRKTLRTIGAITTAGSTTLKPRRKKE